MITYQSYTIDAATTTGPIADPPQGLQLVCIDLPAGFTGTTLTVKTCRPGEVTARDIAGWVNPADVGASKRVMIDADTAKILDRIEITAASQGAEAVLYLGFGPII